MNAVAFSLLSVAVVSAVSLIGLLTLSLREERMQRLNTSFVSFAVGALLGDAFIHLIPELFSRPGSSLRRSLGILGGMLVFFVVEKVIRGHSHAKPNHSHLRRPELATINLTGDGLHNFIDGVVIGASYLVSPTLGLTTTIAVLAHEIPQELGDFAILLRSGLTVRQAALLNLASASVALVGTALVLVAGSLIGHQIAAALVPFTAGGFIYLATADLMPELQLEAGRGSLVAQTALIAGGMAVMVALVWVG